MRNLEKLIGKLIDQILDEISDQVLYVYDFDDTLFETKGSIHLINTDTGVARKIRFHEFHEYELKPNEKFDMDDFYKIIEPKALPTFEHFKRIYQRMGPKSVAICTARPDAEPIREFMDSLGYTDIEIAALGEANPRGNVGDVNASRKKRWIKDKITTDKLARVEFFDDNLKNVEAVAELQKEFCEVKIKAHHVYW